MKYVIQKYKKGQEEEISQLIRKVYDEYVSSDYSEEGNRFFYKWIMPDNIANRQLGQINLLVALINEKIVGVIEIRDNNHISLLFVDNNYHRKGIAGNLYRKALEVSFSRDKRIDRFYVHASPYSIPVYEALGFRASGKMQEEYGIKYLPMEMSLEHFICLQSE